MHWITVEVFDGDLSDGGTSAAAWARAWHDRIVEAAVTGGAAFWDEHEHRWGVVLEFVFADERQRDAFRQAPVLRAALDAAPAGVAVYPHRGGGSGSRQPRRPRPLLQSGAAALPQPGPDDDRPMHCTGGVVDGPTEQRPA